MPYSKRLISVLLFCCWSFLKPLQHPACSCVLRYVLNGKWFRDISSIGRDTAQWPGMLWSRFNLVLGPVNPQIETCRLVPTKSLLWLRVYAARVTFGVWKIWVIPRGPHVWGISTVATASELLLRPGAWSSEEAAEMWGKRWYSQLPLEKTWGPY